jgi:hypothetical protein
MALGKMTCPLVETVVVSFLALAIVGISNEVRQW